MRSRNIKSDFFKDEKIADLSFQARILFVGLWCIADREGRFEWSERRIKVEIFPYDEIDIHRELTVIERSGLILKYEVNGKIYGEVVNFKKHQTPHHTEKKSTFPEYQTKTNGCDLTVRSPLSNGKNPPDSLNHESRIMNPDSLNPDSVCAEPQSVSSPTFIEIPLVSDAMHLVTEQDVAEYTLAYPAVDVRQQLRHMRQWSLANPKKQKTKRGVKGFIASWLGREQDKGGNKNYQKHGGENHGSNYTGISKAKQRENANRNAINEWLAEAGHEHADNGKSSGGVDNVLSEP